MSKMQKYKSYLGRQDTSVSYWAEGAVLDFTEELAKIMKDEGISRSELAAKIGTSKAYVTKVFSGEANFTLETMTKFGLAVNHAIRLHLAPLDTQTVWIDRRVDNNVVTYDAPSNVVNLTPSSKKVEWMAESSDG